MQKKSPEAEEYLELVFRMKEEGREPRVKEIASRLGISPASVSEMLRKLSREGLVEAERYGKIRLTKKGEEEGKRVLRRHRIIEDFLTLLGVKKKKIHEEACVLEHAVSDEVERAMRAVVSGGKLKENVKRLSGMGPGECGKILLVAGGAMARRRLLEMGLVPGTRIAVRRTSTRHGPIEICVRSSCLALGRGVAEKILVEVES